MVFDGVARGARSAVRAATLRCSAALKATMTRIPAGLIPVRLRRSALLAASLSGYTIAVYVAIRYISIDHVLVDPAGSDVGKVFAAAGEAFRAGRPVYSFDGEPCRVLGQAKPATLPPPSEGSS